jgi:hypothetical protein
MTTVRSLPPQVASANADGGGPGERLRRRRRRRLIREELFTIFVLLLALAATLVVLGLQWLDSGQPGNSSAGSSSAVSAIHYTLGGHT